jgi:glycosyltransferase involved in cell wall biosynthesis
MRVKFENVDFNSRSGPNGFGLKLARQMIKDGHEVVNLNQDVQLSFIQKFSNFNPTVLRLDGIYFNSKQDWDSMNRPIKSSYLKSQEIVVQSHFDKELITRFFGTRDNIHVIHNGTDFDLIKQIPAARLPSNITRDNAWMCASAWRPHKRLADNIRLFQELSNKDSIMLVAGSNIDESLKDIKDERIKFIGDLSWDQMISCMKAVGNFVHLAWLDHCPNVVVDAKATGCVLHVTNSGGTCELADLNDKIYLDTSFDFDPIDLYDPPKINFNLLDTNLSSGKNLSIESVTAEYYKVLEKAKCQH